MDRSGPQIMVKLLPGDSGEERIDLKDRLVSFTFEDCEKKTDKLSLQLDNYDLSLFDDKVFLRGNILEVSWGYKESMSPLRQVVITKVKGFQALTVEGHAKSVLMNREKKTRSWHDKKRSDVVKEIAAEHGYGGAFTDVEDTGEVYETINQAGETDARFLRRLAAKENFEFWVDHTGLHFHQRKLGMPPARVFTYHNDPEKGEIIQVNVESDVFRRVGKVKVKGKDPKTKTLFEEIGSNEETERTTTASVIEVVDPETRESVLQERIAKTSTVTIPAQSAAKAKRIADARYRLSERKSIQLSMQVVGDPSILAKTIVEVKGISDYLSGKYYVNDVKHNISSSGYTCDMKLLKDGAGKLAAKLVQESKGAKNKAKPAEKNKLKAVEVVDPETGGTQIEYHAGTEAGG
jgi:phage protein D